MYSRLLYEPLRLGTSFFLFGPRGTGKTTWLKEQLPGAVFLDLLDSVLYTELLAHPVRLRNFIPPRDNPWVVIEERKTRFVLTGSSARSLRRKGTNLLAERAVTFRMHSLTWRELGTDAELATSLSRGHLPAALAAPDPRAFLKSYVQAYLREEVQQEGFARSVGAFSRFLETASFSQASLLNVAEVA